MRPKPGTRSTAKPASARPWRKYWPVLGSSSTISRLNIGTSSALVGSRDADREAVRPGLDDAALLRSTFPPGSCTGAPKVRATEIINALETTARGVYTGGIGYASPVAGLAMNVAIRTFEFSGATVRLGVGGGIVADSDPDGEAFETLVKAAPLLDAVGARFGPELSRSGVSTRSPRRGRPRRAWEAVGHRRARQPRCGTRP